LHRYSVTDIVRCTRGISTFTGGKRAYAESYCIQYIDPDFERRFLGLDGIAVTQLRACERLLL